MFIGIIDDINKINNDYRPPLNEILEYLRVTDFSEMKDGDYPIGEKGIVAKLQRYKTRPASECKPESHEKFIDIQFISSGEESLGWCPFSPELKIEQNYDADKDVTFYKKLVPESCVVLLPRSFAILYPVDVHQPCCSVDENNSSDVTKVVVKVPINLLK